MKSLEVGLKRSDKISFIFSDENGQSRLQEINVVGCLNLLRLLEEWRQKIFEYINDGQGALDQFPGTSHSALLIREGILKAKGQWSPPYKDDEICHCRAISTSEVEDAIVRGCHKVEEIRRATTANTACGTCKENIESMINYRLRD